MDLNLVVVCLTIIALVAIVHGKDRVAEKAISALVILLRNIPIAMRHHKKK